MIEISVNIKSEQIKAALERLPSKERFRILREFKEEFLCSEFSQSVKNIRSRTKTKSFDKITRACETARKRIYEKETKSRS